MIATTNRRPIGARGFSLPEILMAVFILAIGVISIAALLPAGIAQQQRSVDDVLGPAVAEHALAVIRAKVGPEDFGAFEEFTDAAPLNFGPFSWGAGRPDGDWGWLRPAFIPSGEDVRFPRGAVDLFNATRIYDNLDTRSEFVYGRPTDFSGGGFLPGIPYNLDRYGVPALGGPPEIFITREERSWPAGAGVDAARNVLSDADLRGTDVPQYYWECMFQRQGGRVRVAIFVYRVVRDQASRGLYTTAPSVENADWPPLPYRLDLANPPETAFAPFDATVRQNNLSAAPRPVVLTWDEPVDLLDPAEGWTLADQWLLDQNGFVHRVLFGRDPSLAGGVDQEVVLANPVSELPYATGLPSSARRAGVYENPFVGFDGAGFVTNPAFMDQRPDVPNGLADENVVTELWYLPVRDSLGRRLIPVHCTVREL